MSQLETREIDVTNRTERLTWQTEARETDMTNRTERMT